MLDLPGLRQAWQSFERYESLDDLRNAARLESSTSSSPVTLRSACWKAFLFFESDEHDAWVTSITAARNAYDALRGRFSRPPESDLLEYDPLADGAEKQWVAHQDDENLRAEILQDVVRLPDDEFLRDSNTQRIMTSILFVYCKLNPDLSYRQGMHELLAPILAVVDGDALQLQDASLQASDSAIACLFDSAYVEHDAFILFSRVMQGAKSFYEQTSHHAAENPLIQRSNRITGELLRQVDPQLSRHLDRLAIPPQLYLMRWIRLLFGREFDRTELPAMWDIVFAEDTTLDLVDYICLTMLLRIRWELLKADYNTALTLLLRYSAGDTQPKTLAIDALHLRDRLNPTIGRRLIMKYTGKAPEDRRSITPPAMQRNITAVSGVSAFRNALRGTKDAKPGQTDADPLSNIESMLQNTARNFMNKSEQLGIGKAVRTAVDDIHRRAQQIRDVEPASARIKAPRQRANTQARLADQEKRNQQLASILEHSTAFLWDMQKQLAEIEEKNGTQLDLEQVSIAIGKVQFVQLHLQDPTLRLEQRDLVSVMPSEDTMPPTNEKATHHDIPSIEQAPKPTLAVNSDDPPAADASISLSHDKIDHASTVQGNRPTLEQSSYSWMLGQPRGDTSSARRERPETLFN